MHKSATKPVNRSSGTPSIALGRPVFGTTTLVVDPDIIRAGYMPLVLMSDMSIVTTEATGTPIMAKLGTTAPFKQVLIKSVTISNDQILSVCPVVLFVMLAPTLMDAWAWLHDPFISATAGQHVHFASVFSPVDLHPSLSRGANRTCCLDHLCMVKPLQLVNSPQSGIHIASCSQQHEHSIETWTSDLVAACQHRVRSLVQM